jgi:3-deoxy-D-arabino-heptulosonate 7-phosphate (DAHP) synthase
MTRCLIIPPGFSARESSMSGRVRSRPCAVEDRKRTIEIARVVGQWRAVLFRGGAFKPRTSPYAFQGLGEEGLKILQEGIETNPRNFRRFVVISRNEFLGGALEQTFAHLPDR